MHHPDPTENGEAPAPADDPAPEAVDVASPRDEESDVVEPEASESAEERLSRELRESQARLRTVSKAYTDLQGEMKAFRSRMEAQARAKALKRTAELVGALLEPVQNLRRCLENPGEDVASLVDGLKLVTHQFEAAMNKVGLEEISGVGTFFDPNRHEALALTPVTQRELDGKILMVHSVGYAVDSHVLQPAQVIVGKYEAPQQDEDDAGDEEVEASAETPEESAPEGSRDDG